MSLISSQELADLVSDSKEPECEPSRSARSILSADEYSPSTGRMSPASMTLEQSPGKQSDLWMSYAEAFHARTSAQQDRVSELTASVRDYGRSTPDLLASFDPDTSSWRTSQTSLFGGYTEFSETWSRSGMMRRGTAFLLPPLVPI